MFTNLFPIPILRIKLSDEIADAMEEKIVPLLDGLSRENDSVSTDFWEKQIPVHELVPNFFQQAIEAALEFQEHTGIEIDSEMRIKYWTQDYLPNDSHQMHHHGIHGISGTYWVRANEDAGSFRLFSTNPHSDLVLNNKSTEYTVAYEDIWPEKGMMLLFPSYMKHCVMQSGKNAIRTSVSFNFGCSNV